MTSPAQIRAARALLGWSQSDLADAAGISIPTVQRAEGKAEIKAAADSVKSITTALKKAGVLFIEENGGGPGVRLRK